MTWVILAALLAAAADAPASSTLTAPPTVAPAPSLAAALAHEAEGDDAAALAGVESLARTQPAWELPHLEAARLLLKTGGPASLERAKVHLDAVAAVAPENPRGHYLRGLLLEEQGLPFKAARAYETALSYRASYEEARFRLASVWVGLGDWLKAELHYRYLAHARPEWVQVRLQLALVLERQERVADAERELLAAREAQPGGAMVLRKLAEFYERTNRPQLAAKVRAQLAAPESRRMRALKPSKR
ncbi:hypothetical protein DRW03_07860 [Corallococcus sp. H22C18031201]|uniref:hypothetical protein n=1 Tax=Citreicoccus inhibens TaxID=2849499 RepID=UPI000E7477AE|nr:hypothetical protein [Citreicoccus inhibens]MBU8898608.1 hypothetical protein [Citreicoccus inhibens]RJS25032.1 hypothetical protein DRW03_07860 [Corallococcus sp. H22C18031201]